MRAAPTLPQACPSLPRIAESDAFVPVVHLGLTK
jgi:hypothetical protein